MNAKLSLLSLLFTGVFLSGCGPTESNQVKHGLISTSHESESNEPSKTVVLPVDAPVFQVLVDTSQPPYSYRDDSGEIVGFEIDLLKKIAEKEQFHLQLITSDSDGLFEELAKKENHIVASAIEISPELKEEKRDVAVFSNSYVSTQPVAVYVSPKVKETSEIKNSKIGVKKGASFLSGLKKETDNASIERFDSSFLAFQAMVSGEVETSVNDIQVAFHYINEYKSDKLPHSIKIAPIMNKQNHDIVFAVSKDKPEVLQALNSGIEKIKNDGSYEEIAIKWLQ